MSEQMKAVDPSVAATAAVIASAKALQLAFPSLTVSEATWYAVQIVVGTAKH